MASLNPYDSNDEDSLEIKPPQMISRYDKHKTSSNYEKHKKSSRTEHRHKDRSGDRGERHSRHNAQPRHHRDVDDYDKYMSSREMHQKRNRKRYSPEKTDGDRALEDLRSRLLSKRSKQDIERNQEEHQLYQRNGNVERHRSEQYYPSKHHSKKNIIELIDSPENYGDLDNEKYKSDKYKAVEDPELKKRREKLLVATREMDNRKEMAREELKARREMHREKEQIAKSPHSHERSSHHRSHKRKQSSPDHILISDEEKEFEKNQSSGSDNDDDDDEDDTASDSDTNSKSSKSDRSSKANESDVATSPLSVGSLTKSDHRRCRSQSRSKSHSTSRSRSKSRSTSRSRSRSRSSSRSDSRRRSSSRHSDRGKSKQRDRRASTPPSDGEDVEMKSIPLSESKPGETKEPPPKENAAAVAEEDLPSYYPGLQGCRSVEEFKCLNRIAEGTYGIVFRAQDKRTEEIVALKRLKMEKEKDGFPITSLREINTLLKGQHPNIVTVREIVVGNNMDKIFIVMDYVEHDFKTLMETMHHRKQSFLPAEVKCLTQQLLRAVAHLHDNWILHRDLKTSNLLLSHKGILKVDDFGLAREYGSPLKAYTSIVVTLWYRAPELLLMCKEYSTPIDMWSVGCIFAEFLQMCPLFPGQSETDQLNKIFKFLGTPNEKVWPGYSQIPAVQKIKFTEYPISNVREKFGRRTSDLGLQLLQGLLTYDPKQRFTAEQALRSNYFKELPLPIDPAMLPTWPAKSELGARKALAQSPKPPSGGSQFKKLGASDVDENRSFILGASLDAKARNLAMGPGFSLKF